MSCRNSDDPSRDPTPTDPAEGDSAEPDQGAGGEIERPLFRHPPWMIGIVVIFGVLAVVAGLDDPIWLLIGSPFILVLLIYPWVRWMGSR